LVAANRTHKMSSASKKKDRQCSDEYRKFGFILAPQDEQSPFCLLCQHCFANESLREGRLKAHLKAKHDKNYDLNQFKSLKEKFEKRSKIDSLKNLVFWDVAPYSVNRLLHPENGGNTFLRNVGAQDQHGNTSQKTTIFIVAAVKI
jgi:hypothetical protein